MTDQRTTEHRQQQGIARRAALGLIGGSVAGLALSGAASAAAMVPPALALATPEDRLRAFMLMRGSLDDRLVIGFLDGLYFGCVNGEMKPLFGVISATFSRFRPLPNGTIESVTAEQAYYTDLDSGTRLTRYTNPYTGQSVDVPTGGYPPSKTIFTPDLEMHVVGGPPGMVLEHKASPIAVRGDDVWLTETTTVTTPTPAGRTPRQFHEVVGLHARLGDMIAPGVTRVRCITSYTSVKSWRPWLLMDDHPGETVSTGQGMYGASIDDLPPHWLTAARAHRPELISDPASVLDPLWRA